MTDRPKKKHRLRLNLLAAGPPDDPTIFLEPGDGAPPEARKITHRLGKPKPPESNPSEGTSHRVFFQAPKPTTPESSLSGSDEPD